MNKRILHLLPLVLFHAFAIAQTTEESVTFVTIAQETQLVSSTTVDALPDIGKRRDFFIWPSQEKMTASLKESDLSLDEAKQELANPNWITTEKISVTQAKRISEKWIKTVLLDKWIPIDIERMLIALDSDVDGYDTIRVRYEMEGFYIQISQTDQEIGIVISNQNIGGLGYEQLLDLFFRDADKIKQCMQVENVHGGKRGEPTLSAVSRNQYWGNTRLWVSGECHLFSIMKYYGGAGRPMGLPKDWF